jgi:hypothetical protein
MELDAKFTGVVGEKKGEGGRFVDPVLPMKAVLQDPRYRAAPDGVKAFYWGAISLLWEEAEHSATGPRLKRRLLPGAALLIDWGLAREVAGEVEIGWLTKAWIKADAHRQQARAAARASHSAGALRQLCGRSAARTAPAEVAENTQVSPQPSAVKDGTQPALKIPEELVLEIQETHRGGMQGGVFFPNHRRSYPPGFERFWKAYPVRREKSEAYAVWKKLGCEAFVDLVVTRVELLKAEDHNWLRGFVKHPKRWLSAEGWEDDPIAAPPSAAEVACAEFDRRMGRDPFFGETVVIR